jgi:hypothetical protein
MRDYAKVIGFVEGTIGGATMQDEYMKHLSELLNDLNNTPEFGQLFWDLKVALRTKGYNIDYDETGTYVVNKTN